MTLAGDALAGAAPAGDDRAAVIACVQAGLHALEVGDDAAWREHLETLLRWRARRRCRMRACGWSTSCSSPRKR